MKGERFELVTLRGGARAVRDLAHGEVMHPGIGPWEEANGLYVEQGRLSERLAEPGERPVRVYDVGLGGGANAVAALAAARRLGSDRRRPLEVISFERDTEPLTLALGDLEGFPFLAPWREAAQALLADGSWEAGGLSWRLRRGDALEALEGAPGPCDLVFFDPFSPRQNPGLWSARAFGMLRARCRDEGRGGQLFTYSAATPTRVSLLLGGFFVGVGRATGGRGETTAASTVLEQLEHPLDARWLDRWSRSPAKAPHGSQAGPELETAVLGHPQWKLLGLR